MTFLGFLIDTENQIVLIPIEKVQKALELIDYSLNKKDRKVTVKHVQKVCGFLNFLSRAIVPGRVFTRRLYSVIPNKAKPHHHIKITRENIEDLKLWRSFLCDQSAYCREFIEFSKIWTPEELDFYTDASGNFDLGCGGRYRNFWFILRWDKQFMKQKKPSIEYLELYAITVGLLLWMHKFPNRQVQIYTDNESSMNMINNTSSGCRNCMVLLRIIVLEGLKHNVRIFAKHVKSEDNDISDSLSRFKWNKFKKLVKEKNLTINKTPETVPNQLWPMCKLWID